MGRKLTEDELNDPDFQALLVAVKKVSKPVVKIQPAAREPEISRTVEKPRDEPSADVDN